MMIDRRITNGLAWAGVLLVVGVPAADMVSARFLDKVAVEPAAQVAVVERIAPVPAPLSQRPAEPVAAVEVAAVTPARPTSIAPSQPAAQVAAVTPAQPPAVATPARSATETAGAVDAWINSGKPLPSYITDAPSTPTQVAATPSRTPIVTTPAATSVDPIQVASIPQPKIAPVPMPLSMRPHAVASTPVAVVRPSTDMVVAPPGGAPRPPANVTADDLEDWESGPLSEFLAQRQAQAGQGDATYDGDGFFLDEGPNGQPHKRDRLIGPADAFFFPFAN